MPQITLRKETIQRLVNDVSEIIKHPLEEHGIYYIHNDENILEGHAMIIGPEKIEKTSGTEEMIFATLDLERVKYLRSRDDSITEPKPFSSIPGLLRARRRAFRLELPSLLQAQRHLVSHAEAHDLQY